MAQIIRAGGTRNTGARKIASTRVDHFRPRSRDIASTTLYRVIYLFPRQTHNKTRVYPKHGLQNNLLFILNPYRVLLHAYIIVAVASQPAYHAHNTPSTKTTAKMPPRKSTSSATPADPDADLESSPQGMPSQSQVQVQVQDPGQSQSQGHVTATEQQIKARAESGVNVDVSPFYKKASK